MRLALLPFVLSLPLPLAAHSGHDHGPVDDPTKFANADTDNSGSLTNEEFATTFSTVTPEGSILRNFKKTDTDRSGSISLEEWLTYRATTPEGRARTAFEAADTDGDEFLDLNEFAGLMTGNKAFIYTRDAFLKADEDEDSYVTLGEWIDYGSLKGPNKIGNSKFRLADLDGSDSVSPDEFALTYPTRVKPAVIMKKFVKLDRNEDSMLTRDEWNPGPPESL